MKRKYLFFVSVFVLLLCTLGVLIFVAQNSCYLPKLVFLGDSITYLGENGFVSIIRKEFKSNYCTINAGVGGNTIYKMFLRSSEYKNSAIVVIWGGPNDIVQKINITESFYYYEAIVNNLNPPSTLILISPALLSGLYAEMDEFTLYTENLAKKYHCSFINMRRAFLAQKNVTLTVDGLHLNSLGNELAAKLIAKELNKIKK